MQGAEGLGWNGCSLRGVGGIGRDGGIGRHVGSTVLLGIGGGGCIRHQRGQGLNRVEIARCRRSGRVRLMRQTIWGSRDRSRGDA